MKNFDPKIITWIVGKNYHSSLSRIYKETQTLSKNGYIVNIISVRTNFDLLEKERSKRVSIYRISVPILSRIFGEGKVNKIILLFWTVKVLRVLLNTRPNMVYCSNLYTTHIGYILKRIYNTPFVYDSHDLFIDQTTRFNNPFMIRMMKMKYEKFISQQATVVIQTTNSRAKKFEEYYKITPEVIMNKPISKSSGIEIPKELKELVDSGNKIIGYVGSIHDNRGLEQMIEISQEIENVSVVILGYATSKWGQEFLQKWENKIVWIPAVRPDRIVPIIKYFTIGITLIQNTGLSYFYSCPTKVFEFVVAGVPQLSSHFPEISNLLIKNKFGRLGVVVDPSDRKEIKSAIIKLLSSEKQLSHYRTKCSEIKRLCTWESQENIYVTLVSRIFA